ncbi:helix-turn-helix transcriptional regulator [Arthrobacter sp. Sa2BUA2]|uniref:Helix-turn-helix transcriptional regulator n=1 Tax=Arthrobacter pullicola TaxID=2762224 RepID=A0ABR8YLT5_9MICC|nr:LuxR family transcriptional regulator [Arthrobacter pullicola]MBD8045205.1 helix-turn-helix transcriptional regulator [Arthrobacter pullicola]
MEAETDLPYAALQRMVLAHRDALDDLAETPRAALVAACGLAEGPVPPAPRPLVGLGLLHLLARFCEDAPLVCFIDDAQWVDPESLQVLAFAGRRLTTERIVLLFAVRTNGRDPGALDDLPGRTLAGLNHEDALRLLASVASRTLDRRVADQIIEATGGNPLALLDLLTDLSVRQLCGEELLPEPVPVSKRLADYYLRQDRRLPSETQKWLLTAATEPSGNLEAIAAACTALGLRDDASHPAELAGLARVGTTVTFRHPLVRSAIYNGASSHDIRSIHGHLADAAESRGDTYQRVMHRAAATIGPDDGVASELEGAADLAAGRGGYSARTKILLRAAALSSTGKDKDLRLLAAAESAAAAGSGAQASALLRALPVEGFDDVTRGRILLAQCELDILVPGGEFADRVPRLLAAARIFRTACPQRAKQAAAQVFWALVQADDLVDHASSWEAATEARLVCRLSPGPDLPTQSLIALSTLVLDGHAAAAPLVHSAVRQATALQTSDDDVLQSFMLIAYAAFLLREPTAAAAVLKRAGHSALNRGAELAQCRIDLLGAHFDLQLGKIQEATVRLNGAAALMSMMGLPGAYAQMVISTPALHGWLGSEAAAQEDSLTADARAAGYGTRVASRLIRTVLLRASQGRYVEAWDAGQQLRYEDPFFSGSLFVPDLLESASRAGDRQAAIRLLDRLQAENRDSTSRWAAGLVERGMALVMEDGTAAHFDRALDFFSEPALEMDAARTHLLYGEWLRRRRRRNAAAGQLSQALEIFHRLGVPGWSERARRELAALGDSRHESTLPASLTPQELSVARLAAAGYTNAGIAAQLFVSSSTVDYHLRKVFRKLGVVSRRQLQNADLDGSPAAPVP